MENQVNEERDMNTQTTEEFLPDTVEDCMAEIDEREMDIDRITAQIDLYDEGLLDGKPADWKGRAVGALIHKRQDISQLRREILHIKGDDSVSQGDMKEEIRRLERCVKAANGRADRYFAAIEKQKEQLQNQKNSKSVKLSRIHHTQQRTQYEMTKAKQYVSEHCPQLLSGLHACLALAGAEYDAASPAKEQP